MYRSVIVLMSSIALAGCGRTNSTQETLNEISATDDTEINPLAERVSIKQTKKKSSHGLYGAVRFVSVGIDSFKNQRIPKLGFAERDAVALANELGARYGFDCRTPILGEAATRDEILKVIREEAGALSESEVLVVYIATHGQKIQKHAFGAAGFLVPYSANLDLEDRDIDKWQSEAISFDEILSTTRESKAKHVVCLFDTCCSGLATHRGGTGLKERVDLQVLALLPSRIAVAATTDDSPALEDRIAGYGYFAKALLSELKKERALSLTELFEAARKNVITQTGGVMTPQMGKYGVGNGEFVFVPEGVIDENLEQQLEELELRLQSRMARFSTMQDVIDAFEGTDYRFSDERVEMEREWKERFNRFLENASLNDTKAAAGLHYCYSKGLGTEINPGKAYSIAAELAERDDPIGKHLLGRCFINGIGVEKNESIGNQLIGSAAESGFPISFVTRGMFLIGKNQIREGRELLDKAVDAGIPSAMFQLSILYNGNFPPIERDVDTAIALLTRAADLGHTNSMIALSEIYSKQFPWFPEIDTDKVERYMRMAAKRGNPIGQFELAREYCRGVDNMFAFHRLHLDPDKNEARRLLRLSASQGLANAQVALARDLADGRLGASNHGLAREWCDKAVEQSNADACFLKGAWYHDGTLYSKDLDVAVNMWSEAADLGSADACFFLGEMYLLLYHPKAEPTVRQQLALKAKPMEIIPSIQHIALYWYLRAQVLGGHPKAEQRLKEFVHFRELPFSARESRPPIDYSFYGPEKVIENFRLLAGLKDYDKCNALLKRLLVDDR
ncbi:MAG: caspase family protein [Planctomycetaceae bacterium]